MSVFNISLNEDLLKIFRNHIFQNYSALSPNFSQILVLLPSKQMANKLKMEFAEQNIIAPKIISIAEVEDNFLFSLGIFEEFFEYDEISDLQARIFLYKITKQYLQDFSVSSCFSYIEDFLSLENMMLMNKTDIAENIIKLEGVIANFSAKLQNSLINFLKILHDWQAFKRENQKTTRFEKNIFSIESLIKNLDTLPFKQICILGASGTNALQQDLMKKISALPNGSVFLSGLELENEKKMGVSCIFSLVEKFSPETVNFLEAHAPLKPVYHFAQYDNAIIKASQIALNIKASFANKNIGIVAMKPKTGALICNALENLGLDFSSVFTESAAENEIFRLFETMLRAYEKPDFYLSLIKNHLTNFEKTEAELFEKRLRKPDLLASKPFKIPQISQNISFFGFLETGTTELAKILNAEALAGESLANFLEFVQNIKGEVEDFSLPKISDYFAVLSGFASKIRFRKVARSQISVLSAVEARGEMFDVLFIADLSSDVIPEKSGNNKILNGYLQELLGLKQNANALEWFDFTGLLHSAKEVFLCFAKTDFEEKKSLEHSPFLSHALLFFDVKPFDKYFFTHEKSEILLPNPEFNLEIMPNKITPTSLKNLINNPYSFYVSSIISLKSPNEISGDIEQKIIGEIIHEAIFKFFKYGNLIGETCKKELFERGFPFNYFLYENAFSEISQFFLEERELLLADPPEKVLMEEEIAFKMPVFFETFQKEKIFNVMARPDKIEFYKNEIRIIDYKVYSEKIPLSHIAEGREPQLLLQSLILNEMLPDFTGKIRLFYYYINLHYSEKTVEKIEIPIQNLTILKKSIEKLLNFLPNFFYKKNDENFFYNHLIRLYE